jgi:probable HAF family extracellular repeat protein
MDDDLVCSRWARSLMRGVAAAGLAAAALVGATIAPATATGTAAGRVIVDLGTLGGNENSPQDLNKRGQVVGTSTDAEGRYWAYLWDNGAIRNITPAGPTWSSGLDINERGEAVGYAVVGQLAQAFLWSGGHSTLLPSLAGGRTVAEAINDRGQVVGYSTDGAGANRAVLWEHGRVIDLAPGQARAINNHGQVLIQGGASMWLWDRGVLIDLQAGAPGLGLLATQLNERGDVILSGFGPTVTGWMWRDGRLTQLDAPASGGCEPASALNDHGQIAGSIVVGDACHASLGSVAAPLRDLGTLAGYASGRGTVINNRGDVAGYSTGGFEPVRATLWTGDRIVDLGLPGETSSLAVAINDHGQVLAVSVTQPGTFRTFLSSPSNGRRA